MEKKRRRKGMATQIAPTPIIYGEEAKKILEEAKKIPSEQSKRNSKKLMELFSKIEKKGFK